MIHNFIRVFRDPLFSAFVLLSFAGQSCVYGVTQVELPRSFTDFAMNPETGDMFCVDTENAEVVVLSEKYITNSKTGIRGTIAVGKNPVCASFKRVGNKSYILVACAEAGIYVIDAVSGKIVKKISVGETGVTWITNSQNKSDPFAYYCYGRGHDSTSGAIDLRRMTDCGVAIDDSMDCMISADGKTAYRRGPFSPSGFESLTMTTSFSDKAPKFTRLFYDHNSTLNYVPDKQSEYTAAGTNIYTADLKKKVATLSMVPVSFSSSRPVAICANSVKEDRRRRLPTSFPSKLQCISTNTFQEVGDEVEIGEADAPKEIPQRGPGRADFKKVTTKIRYFLHEKTEQLFVFRDNKLTVVALEEFGLPDEVPMQLAKRNYELIVGKPAMIDLRPTEVGVKVEVEDLPDGAKLDREQLKWTPAVEQVGTEKFRVQLKRGDVEKEIIVQLSVGYPSIRLGSVCTQLAVSPDGKEAIAWSQNPFPREIFMAQNGGKEPRNSVFVVDLEAGQVTATKDLPYMIATATIDGHYVYIASAETNYVQVFSKEKLAKKKTLYGDARINAIETDGETLKFEGRSYRLPDLRVTKASVVDNVMNQLWTPDARVTRNRNNTHGLPPEIARQMELQKNMASMSQFMRNVRNGRSSQPARLPGSAVAFAWHRQENRRVPGGTHTQELLSEVGLEVVNTVSKERIKSVKLSSKVKPMEPNRSRMRDDGPKLEVRGNLAVILAHDEIFTWKVAGLDDGDQPKELKIAELKPQVIKPDGEHKVKLEIEGGAGPYSYTLVNATAGIDVDDEGVISIDNELVTKQCSTKLSNAVRGKGRYNPPTIKSNVDIYDKVQRAKFEKLLKRDYKRLPVRLDFVVRAIDSEAQRAEGMVTVVVGVEKQFIIDEIEKLKNEREQQLAAQQEAVSRRQTHRDRQARDGASDDSREIELLKRKIETLESRLDLMTRQMNEILKALKDDEGG